jgi:hypothetical protein
MPDAAMVRINELGGLGRVVSYKRHKTFWRDATQALSCNEPASEFQYHREFTMKGCRTCGALPLVAEKASHKIGLPHWSLPVSPIYVISPMAGTLPPK